MDTKSPRDTASAPPAATVTVPVAARQQESRAKKVAPRSAPGPLVRSVFPPIGDYGFLSDCETTALVAPDGGVEWLCLPRMDSPSVFAQLLDRGAGGFRLAPADATTPAARRYLPGTNILETSWSTGEGWIIVRDALLIGPWRHQHPQESAHVRPPTDYDAEHVLLRTIRCVNGSVQVNLDCDPAFDYGRTRSTWEYADSGYHQARTSHDGLELTLTTDLRLGFEGSHAVARTLLREGDERYVALSWGHVPPPGDAAEAEQRLTWTAHHWQHWLARGAIPDHPWRGYLARSALTLKGLMFAPTGAIAAAATTSLPELPGGNRNYDYRFTWVRDATFALWGLYSLGFDWDADDFFAFVTDLAERDGGRLQIVYGIGGQTDLTESTLDHLHGYDGATPVRIGNAAYAQQQNDVWGAVLDAFYLHAKSRDRIADRLWPLLRRQVQQAADHWQDPDQGIWEVRGAPRHFTSSKVMCWVALDRGARLARVRGELDMAAAWQEVADTIHQDVLDHGVDDRGVFTQHYDTTDLDASCLLIPLVRFLPADDPRVRATVLAIADELTCDGLVMRYWPQATDDGFTGGEGSFTICSFWMVSALCEIGETLRARRLCEKLLGFASPLGLYAEELDPTTGRHLGNFPQAFTHLALINAVMHVIRAEQAEQHVTANKPTDSGR